MKDCNQCGKCCIKYADGGLSASAEEIDWWQVNRPDIARYVGFGESAGSKQGKIWCDPATGAALSHCPWLVAQPAANSGTTSAKTLYSCSIYHDRPDDCRHYPVDINQMVVDDCEMLEPHDLKNTQKAQRSLDRIMLTSRPSGA